MANIARYGGHSPIEDMFNELTRGFFVKPLSFPTASELQIKLDVKEGDKAYTVRAEIPGVRKEDIHVSECSYGEVSRGFDLPSDVDAQGAKAECKDGVVLNLTLPKKPGAETRRISIA